MADKIKKILMVHIPVGKCNFKCPYCYIGQLKKWDGYNEELGYLKEPDILRQAFSKERFGGPCFVNVCAKAHSDSVNPLKQLRCTITPRLLSKEWLSAIVNH